jgi:hypothetical protein
MHGAFWAQSMRVHTLNASITKRTARGQYTIEAQASQTILGYEPAKSREFLAYITNDGLEFHMMFLDKEDPMFKVFTRKPADTSVKPSKN